MRLKVSDVGLSRIGSGCRRSASPANGFAEDRKVHLLALSGGVPDPDSDLKGG